MEEEEGGAPVQGGQKGMVKPTAAALAQSREDGESAEKEARGASEGSQQLGAEVPLYLSREEVVERDEKAGTLTFREILNDNDPQHLVWLINLKTIFSNQLPKMPREYIVRLVLDRRHRSVAAIKEGKVVGGICFRPYFEQRFAEIAFCAITASEQVKGYGTRLMNHVKECVKRCGITHFLTYADNFAIGYFKKQGFSKHISMPRERWHDYIKDYDGGTLMECAINQSINYVHIHRQIEEQRRVILERIKQASNSAAVYPPLAGLGDGRIRDIFSVPGVREAGWTPPQFKSIAKFTAAPTAGLAHELHQVVTAMEAKPESEAFRAPVDRAKYPKYYEEIKDPIDLSMIKQRLAGGNFYRTKRMFVADLERMARNATLFNGADHQVAKDGSQLLELAKAMLEM